MGTPGKAIPDGHNMVIPYLVIKNASEAIEFYKKAFGAEEILRLPGPVGGSVMHAELKIGNGFIYMTDENPEWNKKSPATIGTTPVSLHIYVEDVDAFFQRAIAAGATETMPVADTFWGDRYGGLKDPFGHEWGIATHKKDMTPEEIEKGAQEWFASMANK
jgi:PhnB protein